MKIRKMYSLFAKIEGKNIRLSFLQLPKPRAIEVFQNALLQGSFAGIEMSLKVVPIVEKTEADYIQFDENYEKFRALTAR